MKPRPEHQSKALAPTQRVQIEKPIYGGSFLARDAGKVLFVPFALPGEEARIHIAEDKGKRGYATAALEEIVSAAPERIAPACPYFGSCGGCNYQHADYSAQLGYKQAILRETFERGGVAAPEKIDVLAAEPWGYRNRIRLAFDAAGRPGYRANGSHAIVPIDICPISAPVLVKAALAAAKILRETTPKPRLSEIVLFTNSDETEILATISLASPGKRKPGKLNLDAFANALKGQIPALAGVELVAEGRAPHPPRLLERWGAESIHYNAAGFDYRVDHGAFFQVNRWLVDALVEQVVAGHSGELAWDLFAGVGLFSRQLAVHYSHVVAVESAPFATDALEANLIGTGGEAVRATTLDFLRRNRSAATPELVVADPPRAGLGAEVTAELARVAAPEMTYVSCDPATLVRDLRSLVASGYAIESVALADLFPQTFHIETIVRLRR